MKRVSASFRSQTSSNEQKTPTNNNDDEIDIEPSLTKTQHVKRIHRQTKAQSNFFMGSGITLLLLTLLLPFFFVTLLLYVKQPNKNNYNYNNSTQSRMMNQFFRKTGIRKTGIRKTMVHFPPMTTTQRHIYLPPTPQNNTQPFAPMGTMIYGTNRKDEKTSRYVQEAIQAGFRHFATASNHQNKYNESGVGEGWISAVIKSRGELHRRNFFLQTMFVPQGNNDWIDENYAGKDISIEEQVRHSIRSSLIRLRTDYIDAVIYHNFRSKLLPFEEMMRAWKVLEEFVDQGIIRFLGIDHVHEKEYLQRLIENSRIKPSIVQNRFHQNRQFDVNLRSFFKQHDIISQGFWVLTGNGHVAKKESIVAMAEKKKLTPHTLMYVFAMSLGISPMTGTQTWEHMVQDVEIARRWKEGEKFFEGEERKEIADAFKMSDLK